MRTLLLDCSKSFIGDYEALKQRLTTLPDKISYDVTVSYFPIVYAIYTKYYYWLLDATMV